jgi:transcriptional regulator with XRE-family HTH domain
MPENSRLPFEQILKKPIPHGTYFPPERPWQTAKSLRDLIRLRRLDLALSQAEFRRRCDLSDITRFESGRHKGIRSSTLARLATGLDLPLEIVLRVYQGLPAQPAQAPRPIFPLRRRVQRQNRSLFVR